MQRRSKLLLSMLTLVFMSFTLYAQVKPTLTILPYRGASDGDAETIGILLANQDDIRNTFLVIPCTSNFNEIASYIESAGANLTKDGVIAAVKSRLNAQFAVIIRTERIGNSKLALFSMVNTETLQQIAGGYRKYNSVREIRAFLPDLIKRITIASQIDAAIPLPKLTMLPFYTPRNGVEVLDADILVQLLTIELANSGKYVVLPWDLILQTIITDFQMPYLGIIDPDKIKTFGSATAIDYVLAGDILNLGTTNLFMTSIVNTRDASILTGGDIEYRVITEDIPLISDLASLLIYGRAEGDIWVVKGDPQPTDIQIIILEEDFAASIGDTPAQGSPTPNAQGNLVRIPGGDFIMGSPASEVSRDEDEIQHQVRVVSFYIGKNAVTQREFQEAMGTNPSAFQSPDLPVEQASWFDAIRYCNVRSIKEGLNPAYTIDGDQVTWDQRANGYRLPTEAEWEYACRAGTTTTFNTGDNFTSNDGNYDGTYSYNKNPVGIYRQTTTPGGTFAPNAWGLYDMHGNVYEWCWDWYAPYNSATQAANTGGRVVRGGSWYSAPRYLRSGNRAYVAPGVQAYYIGFRVVRNAVQ
jgi:formylglycine-generating enzyme required for sulfatase activity